jgi:hypothetical protein
MRDVDAQGAHDTARLLGARCHEPKVNGTTDPIAYDAQTFHDIACELGAHCSDLPPVARIALTTQQRAQLLHDITLALGAKCNCYLHRRADA